MCRLRLEVRSELRALRQRLTRPGHVPARAVALAAQLAWDPASPVYAANDTEGVADIAHAILDLLDEESRLARA